MMTAVFIEWQLW